MKSRFLFLLISLISAGCMQAKALPHMNELLTLKAYSEERDAQAKWVEARQQVFEQLLAAVKDGSIKDYSTQDEVLKAFGPAVLSEDVEQEGASLTRWLYRNPIQKFATDRIYLYFSPDGQMRKFEHITSL